MLGAAVERRPKIEQVNVTGGRLIREAKVCYPNLFLAMLNLDVLELVWNLVKNKDTLLSSPYFTSSKKLHAGIFCSLLNLNH